MSGTNPNRPLGVGDIVLRAAIVALTLSTAYIHLTLGGLLFSLNAVGYLVGAVAMAIPLGIAVRYRWLIRIGLAGYAAATITAWVIDPVLYSTAYLAKSIEVALIASLAFDFVRRDGNPIHVIPRKIQHLLSATLTALAMIVLVACSSGATAQTAEPSVDPNAVRIAARGLTFSTSTLTAPADAPFRIAFDNQESAPHNVAIYRDSSATEQVFGSEPFGGPAMVNYEVPALAAGRYFFRCDVHPDMAGQLMAG